MAQKDVRFYVDIGEFGLDEELKLGVDSLTTFLSEQKIPYRYEFVPNSIPDNENMASRVITAILHFFKKEK